MQYDVNVGVMVLSAYDWSRFTMFGWCCAAPCCSPSCILTAWVCVFQYEVSDDSFFQNMLNFYNFSARVMADQLRKTPNKDQ